eukprot:9452214-Pyramimonas_sp.AAC.1
MRRDPPTPSSRTPSGRHRAARRIFCGLASSGPEFGKLETGRLVDRFAPVAARPRAHGGR